MDRNGHKKSKWAKMLHYCGLKKSVVTINGTFKILDVIEMNIHV